MSHFNEIPVRGYHMQLFTSLFFVHSLFVFMFLLFLNISTGWVLVRLFVLLFGFLGCLTSWRFLYLNLKAKFALLDLVKCSLDTTLLSCIAGGVYMGQPQMQFTPQGYATAVAGSIPPTTTMMGGGAVVSGMALPNGGYMSMQQGAMPANQGQNMYSMQQGQWNMGQVTGRNSNLCIKVQSEWWLTFSFLPTPVAVNIWIHT